MNLYQSVCGLVEVFIFQLSCGGGTMRTTKNQSLFISIFVSLLIVVSIPFSTAAEWNERMCETGDYIPLALYGVWGSSPVDIFFVGASGYILHYDGSQCAVMWGNPFTGKIANLYDIWGSSKNDVFAVGGNNGEILHYDGVKWTLMRKALVDQQLYGIWGYSPQDVFAVGSGGVILHYDGETWSEMDSGTVFTLNDIWGTTPDNIFAVGNAGTILHYNGEMWSAASMLAEIYMVSGEVRIKMYMPLVMDRTSIKQAAVYFTMMANLRFGMKDFAI